jgi:hypothetical protein
MKPTELKTSENHFQDIWNGIKTFEIRSTADRTFKVGQHLLLRETCLNSSEFKGRAIEVKITHLLTSEMFSKGLKPNYACLSIQILDRINDYGSRNAV